jgi:hypothetical protein
VAYDDGAIGCCNTATVCRRCTQLAGYHFPRVTLWRTPCVHEAAAGGGGSRKLSQTDAQGSALQSSRLWVLSTSRARKMLRLP